MKLNFNKPLLNLEKNPIFEGGPDGKPTQKLMTFRVLCASYVMANKDEPALSPEEKYKRGKLASKIYESESETDLSIEEAALLKSVCGKYMEPLYWMRTCDFLESAE